MGLRGPKSGKLEECVSYLLKPGTSKSDARAAGFPNGTVTNAARKVEQLRAAGVLPPPRPSGEIHSDKPTQRNVSMKELEQMATEIALRGASDSTRLRGVETAAKVKMMSGEREDIGPGIPLTQEERIYRFELLRRAVYGDQLPT